MPRKTAPLVQLGYAPDVASMRPRPDAAENPISGMDQRLLFELQ